MQLLTLANFHTTGVGSLPGDQTQFAFVSIGAGSDVEACIVGSRLLSVGSVVPWAGQVLPLRAKRDALTMSASNTSDLGNLELALWRPCEHPIAGPRAPTIRDGVHTAGDGSVANAANNAQLVVSLPFYGRKEASFYGKVGQDNPVNYIIRAVKLRNPANFATLADKGDFIVETTGTFTRSVSTLADGASIGFEINIGGLGDSCEGFDLLELFVYCPIGWGGISYFRGEAFGERTA